jgi:hypothetical protein
MWRSGWVLAVALGVVLGAVAPDDALAARRKKSRIVTYVNGKKVKTWKPTTYGSYAPTGFSVGGGTKPRGRRAIRQVTLTCGILDIATVTLPTTLDCYASYTESETRRTPFEQWVSYGILVTIESYVDGRVSGTFSGTIQPFITDPGEPPVTVENGTFSVLLIVL